MRDMPRVPRDSAFDTDTVEKSVIAFGCMVLIANIVFWSVIAYVVGHFVLKYW
jgi:predicted cobalt transporter CbtA